MTNSREKVLRHSRYRNALGFEPSTDPQDHEIIVHGMPVGWTVVKVDDNSPLSSSAGASRSADGLDWKYAASDNSPMVIRITNDETKEAREASVTPPAEINFAEMAVSDRSKPNRLNILGIPNGWDLYEITPEGDRFVATKTSVNSGPYRGATWRTFKDLQNKPLRIKPNTGVGSFDIPATSGILFEVPESVGQTTSINGSLRFISAGKWAAGRTLTAASANDPTTTRTAELGLEGEATLSLAAGPWIVSVSADTRTTPQAIVAGQTIELTLSAPSPVTIPSTMTTVLVSGVRTVDRLQSSPAATFTQTTPTSPWSAQIPAVDGGLAHVTLMRPDGQNETRTVSLSAGTTVTLSFAPPAVPEKDNTDTYILIGSLTVAAAGLLYALTGKSE